MSVHQNSSPEDKTFKEAAALYINKQGEDLLNEAAYIDSLPFPNIGRVSQKIKSKRRSSGIRKMSAALLPAAACFVLVIIYLSSRMAVPRNDYSAESVPQDNYSAAYDKTAASETAEVQLLTAKLPQGFNLTNTDVDNGQTICYIKSANNDIILVMEEWRDIAAARPMTELDVNGTPMYALQMNDYSLLTYKKGDLRFTLTCPYDYRDLIIIGGLLV